MAPIDKVDLINDILFEINLMFEPDSDSEDVLDTMTGIYGRESLEEINCAISIWNS